MQSPQIFNIYKLMLTSPPPSDLNEFVHQSLKYGSVKKLLFSIAHGLDLITTFPPDIRSLLHMALQYHSHACLSLLLVCGCPIDIWMLLAHDFIMQ
ncbi:hypothetical protein Pelo_153 [Pelomyxa schiedti]|nr:hypothetical protein Pelo_153 [Pelomyxa schiedti]